MDSDPSGQAERSPREELDSTRLARWRATVSVVCSARSDTKRGSARSRVVGNGNLEAQIREAGIDARYLPFGACMAWHGILQRVCRQPSPFMPSGGKEWA
jgi:hypothetical protein